MPSAKSEPAKAKRRYNRRVFGRRTVIRNRDEWLVEMRKAELVVRRKRTRRQYRLALSDLLDIAIGQSIWAFGKVLTDPANRAENAR